MGRGQALQEKLRSTRKTWATKAYRMTIMAARSQGAMQAGMNGEGNHHDDRTAACKIESVAKGPNLRRGPTLTWALGRAQLSTSLHVPTR